MTVAREQADFDWYSETSRRCGLLPRCPFASVDLCPKYYESVSLLGNAEITSPLSEEDAVRLRSKWADWETPLAEQAPSSLRSGESWTYVSSICPEIGYDIFGYFASGFYRYPDEVDADLAYKRLSEEGAPPTDPRWTWARVYPEHYTECRLYSILSATAPSPLPDYSPQPLSPLVRPVDATHAGDLGTGRAADVGYDVFISHATEDKEEIVRPLATALVVRGLRVWYDEFELRIGDSLRRKIDAGLANSRFGVVVLSPNFFAKNWPQGLLCQGEARGPTLEDEAP